MSKRLHVVPRSGTWAVQREKAGRASAVARTQAEALDKAVQIAKREGGEVIVHRTDGTIRDSDSYGQDPNPPKDAKH